MRDITGIIIHCSATRPDWMAGSSAEAKRDEIRRWHVQDRGWKDIGYHFLIDRDGKVVKGRPITKDGAHVMGHNKGTIGVCLIGGHGSAVHDSFGVHFTGDQADALRRLLQQLRMTYGPVPITGHNQHANKGCPGFYVPSWLSVSPVDEPATQPAKRSIWTIMVGLLNRWLAGWQK